ncbi:MAG: thioredoxin family protein [Candidatus Margulisiibacteriota bacterium]
MVLLKSNQPKFNKKYPPFKLKSTSIAQRHSDELKKENGLFIIFTCNHCPYAHAYWGRLIRDFNKINQLGFGMVAINPNINPDYPQDSFENMMKLQVEFKLPFEYLVDEDQEIAKAYDAQCTPDFYVLNSNYELMYRGAYDNNWKNENEVTNNYLLDALHNVKNNKQNKDQKIPSMGCSIKWL